jgi:hypothetical protein
MWALAASAILRKDEAIRRPRPDAAIERSDRLPALRENEHLPELVRSYLARSLPTDGALPAAVRVQQAGEMWKKPGARPLRFTAAEDFAVDRVAFSWRARFPIVGPLAMTVVDQMAGGEGELRVSLLGFPLQTQTGPETTVGEAMRYLAELPWAPHAIAANTDLEWRGVDERTVEVATGAPEARAAVRWRFDDHGDPVGATGERPSTVGKSFVSRPWGGDFGEYVSFGGTRAPTFAEAWWQLPEGRFVYWRAHVTALELLR